MRRIALFICLLASLAVPAVAQADRADDLLVDACRDERVDGTYTQGEFRRAIARLPADSDQYTACREILERARLAALEGGRSGGGGGGGTDGAGAGSTSAGGGGGGGGSGALGGGSAGGGGAGPAVPSVADSIGPGGDPLWVATPQERQSFGAAVTAGGAPVRVGDTFVTPGASGLNRAATALPASLVVLLAAIAALALAIGGPAGWSRVRARRAG